jgi:hypothetical protein
MDEKGNQLFIEILLPGKAKYGRKESGNKGVGWG